MGFELAGILCLNIYLVLYLFVLTRLTVYAVLALVCMCGDDNLLRISAKSKYIWYWSSSNTSSRLCGEGCTCGMYDCFYVRMLVHGGCMIAVWTHKNSLL
jgi:hypothetical protein